MANFQNNAITDVGRSLLSHVQMGAVFTPTKIVVGSGYMPPGKTARTMTAVATPVKELSINKKQRTNDSKAIFGGVYSNQDISQDWYFRELALYAKAVYTDGVEIAECLYSYGNAGDQADLMPAYTTGQPVERQMDLVVYVGNDAKVDLTIESGVYLTQEQAAKMIAEALADIDLDITDDTTGLKYRWGIQSGNAYLKESETEDKKLLVVMASQVGKPNGVAGLDGSGKVPAGQLPAMNYIPTSEKGAAGGVATLGEDGKLVQDVDGGTWDTEPVEAHNRTALAHTNLRVDGNSVAAADGSTTLEEHMRNPLAHQNLVIDGNAGK